MKKRKNQTSLVEIYDLIVEHPGINYTELAELTGLPRSAIEGRLASLEAKRKFIAEDKYGRLYTYEYWL